jgi:hypothetical protein
MLAIIKEYLRKAEFSMETGQEKLEVTDLEANPEEMESSRSIRKSMTKRQH